MLYAGCGGRDRRKVIELSSDSKTEGSKADPKNFDSSLHASEGWLTKRGGSGPIRARLQEFSFRKKKKERQKGGGKISVANGVYKEEYISISSISSQSDSNSGGVRWMGDTASLSSQGGSSSQEASQDTDTTDSSCVIVDTPTVESAESVLRGPARGLEPPNAKSASHVAKFYRRRAATSTSECAESASTGYGLRPCKREPRDLEELERDMESGSEGSDSDAEDSTGDQREAVLEFLNGRDPEELCNIPGCSPSRAKLLTQLRPFRDWSHLVSRVRLLVSNFFIVTCKLPAGDLVIKKKSW